MEQLARLMDLAWFTVAALSVILLSVLEFRVRRERGGFRRTLAVLLAVIVLIPSLSIRDDLIGLAFLSQRDTQRSQPAMESQAGSDFQQGINLLALDHCVLTSFHAPPLNIDFTIWVPLSSSPFPDHSPIRRSGRAPPFI